MAQSPMNPVSGRGAREPGSSPVAGEWDRPEREANVGKGPTGTETTKGGVGEQIKDQAGAMMETAKDMADEAKSKVKDVMQAGAVKAEEAKSAAGETMHTVAEKIRHGGDVVSEKADQLGSYLQQHDFEAIGRDLTDVVRRYPVQSLLVGIGLGILLGRAAR